MYFGPLQAILEAESDMLPGEDSGAVNDQHHNGGEARLSFSEGYSLRGNEFSGETK
jgi:hypothetical protein